MRDYSSGSYGAYRRSQYGEVRRPAGSASKKNTIRGIAVLACCLFYPIFDELLYTAGLNTGFSFYKLMFCLAIGALLYLIACIPKRKKLAFYIHAIVALAFTAIYIIQYVYWAIFDTPVMINSLQQGAGDAMEFFGVAVNKWLAGWPVSCFFCLQIILIFTLYRMLFYKWRRPEQPWKFSAILFAIITALAFILPITTANGINQAGYYMLYDFTPVPASKSIGVVPSMLMDIKFNSLGIKEEYDFDAHTAPAETPAETPEGTGDGGQEGTVTPGSSTTPASGADKETEKPAVYEDNVMNINFNLDESDDTLRSMNEYFSQRQPTKQNEYTGIFQGKNLILMTAEGFSGYVIDPEVTPTLYKMATEGFVFNNFYCPIWTVSTSDGEYVETTGLIPKDGVWSYTEIADNYMPFAFGNQFNRIGYDSYAFHGHTWTYYNRDKSYPTMGYEYYGRDHGLDVERVWPESDVEVNTLTEPYYMDLDHFHVYYMTISGHLEYSYPDNMMAWRNKESVEAFNLGYSSHVMAYIATQYEFEKSLAQLIEDLDNAGRLDDVVIAFGPDHYPYGLTNEEYAELMGIPSLDTTFDMYRSSFILWSSCIKEPVYVDKYCSSLDITPTLQNMFGLKYDSRLFAGRDIMSDEYPGLVVFMDRSFITDKIRYNASTQEAVSHDGSEVDPAYLDQCLNEVAKLFKYSAAIIDTDYYRYLFPDGVEEVEEYEDIETTMKGVQEKEIPKSPGEIKETNPIYKNFRERGA